MNGSASMQGIRVAIACGGTGGHVFPGCAIADELLERGCSVQLVVSPKEVDQQAIRSLVGVEVLTLPAVGLEGGRFLAFLRGWVASRRVAGRAFSRNAPGVVLAMGGFTSAPPVMAGRARGAATFLHESNRIPGRANRWLAHVVDECFVGFAEAGDRLWHPRVVWTGTPVRRQFQPMPAPAARTALGLDPGRPLLLVMGGSQGAMGINEAFLRVAPDLLSRLPEWQVLLLTGVRGEGVARGAVAAMGERGRRIRVMPFLTEMELALASATAVVSRSGASSLAEFVAMGVPSLLVPYPAATDDHQTWNARMMVRAGAAVMLAQSECGGDRLLAELLRLLTNPVRRESMVAAMEGLHRPGIAALIADRLLAFAPVYGQAPRQPKLPSSSLPVGAAKARGSAVEVA